MYVFFAQILLLINNAVFSLFSIFFLMSPLSKIDFGHVMYGLGLATWMAVIIEYGFSLSLPKYRSEKIQEGARLNELIATTLSAKLLLTLALSCIGVIFAVILNIPPSLIFLAILLGMAQGLLPVWFYQGQRQLLLVALIDAFFIVLGIAIVYYYTSWGGKSFIACLFVYALVRLFSALVTNFILMHQTATIQLAKLSLAINLLVSEKQTFIYTLAGSLYTSFNVVILGIFVSPMLIGIYISIERLIRLFTSMIAPMTRTLYPRMINEFKKSKIEAMKVWKKILLFYLLGSSAITVCAFLMSDNIILFIFKDDSYLVYANIFQVLIFTIPCIAVSNVLGGLFMLPNNMEKQASSILLVAGTFNVLASLVIVNFFGILGMAEVVLVVEILILTLMSYFVSRKIRGWFYADS